MTKYIKKQVQPKQKEILGYKLVPVLILIMILMPTMVASAEVIRRIELTCFDREVITHHFVLGEIDPTTKFLVKELRMAGSRPYVLLENTENKYEIREFVWSAGWRCLLERHIKK